MRGRSGLCFYVMGINCRTGCQALALREGVFSERKNCVAAGQSQAPPAVRPPASSALCSPFSSHLLTFRLLWLPPPLLALTSIRRFASLFYPPPLVGDLRKTCGRGVGGLLQVWTGVLAPIPPNRLKAPRLSCHPCERQFMIDCYYSRLSPPFWRHRLASPCLTVLL